MDLSLIVWQPILASQVIIDDTWRLIDSVLANKRPRNGIAGEDYGSVAELSLWFVLHVHHTFHTRHNLFVFFGLSVADDTFFV